MLSTKESPTRTLNIISPSGRSLETEKQRYALFDRMYGPAGREFHRGLKDGSLTIHDLPRFAKRISTHFSETIREEYSIPEYIRTQDFYTDLQGIGIGVVRRIIREAFPHMERRLGQFKNEVLLKAPNPTTLFKILALQADQVDRKLAFNVVRQLIIADTAGPLYVRSKHADVNQKLSDWHDIFNEELFEGPYGTGESYQLYAYHDSETNRVIRFNPANGAIRPPKGGEHLAIHNFSARRIKDYGLAYVDVTGEGVVDATIKALAAAANNEGKIQSARDGKIGMKMTFVDLEAKPRRKGEAHNTPHLTLLKKRVMTVMLKHMDIANMKLVERDQGQADNSGHRSNTIELYAQDLPKVPIKLEFLNRTDYLDGMYHVGVKSFVDGIPEPVYNGRAAELLDLREYYPLMPSLFPQEIYGINTQDALLTTMDKTAAKLRDQCMSTVTQLDSEDIKAMIGKSAI